MSATFSLQFERDDILSSYRALFEESKRLEAGADELNGSRKQLAQVTLP
jgi:hypothetical protein